MNLLLFPADRLILQPMFRGLPRGAAPQLWAPRRLLSSGSSSVSPPGAQSTAQHTQFTNHLDHSTPLGKATAYVEHYDPRLLAPVPRKRDSSLWVVRRELFPNSKDQAFGSVRTGLPVHSWGFDRWTGYELSWLNERGKPLTCAASFDFPALSPSIVESKSFKLYLNSFNQTRFARVDDVRETMRRDLSAACGAPVTVQLHSLDGLHQLRCFSPNLHDQFALDPEAPAPVCVDDLDVEITGYQVNPGLLRTVAATRPEEAQVVRETLYSHLLKSNCPVTGQPDWATVIVQYMVKRPSPAAQSSGTSGSAAGKAPATVPLQKLCRESLLRYLVSYRGHADFHEHCLESIAGDVYQRLVLGALESTAASGARGRPVLDSELPRISVQAAARYTRRGGLDINPVRQLAGFRLPMDFVHPLEGSEAIAVADCPAMGLGLGPELMGHVSRQ